MDTKAPIGETSFDQVYKHVVIDNFKNPLQVNNQNKNLSSYRTCIADSALGVGQIFSSSSSLQLWQHISPRILQLGAGSLRALGGITTAATSGYRILDTYREERASGATKFDRTRKELFLSSASITSGFIAGSLAGGALAGATVLGAPALVLGGIGAVGIVGVGYAASWTRDWAGRVYERLI